MKLTFLTINTNMTSLQLTEVCKTTTITLTTPAKTHKTIYKILQKQKNLIKKILQISSITHQVTQK
jgi:hypothetical protein